MISIDIMFCTSGEVKTTLGAYPAFQNAIFCLQNEVGTPQNAVYRHFKSTFYAFIAVTTALVNKVRPPEKRIIYFLQVIPANWDSIWHIFWHFLAYIPTFILTDKEDEDEEGGGGEGGEGEGVAPPLYSWRPSPGRWGERNVEVGTLRRSHDVPNTFRGSYGISFFYITIIIAVILVQLFVHILTVYGLFGVLG